MSNELTLDVLQRITPSKTHITQELVDDLNQMLKGCTFAEEYRNNFITYSRVLEEGRFKVSDYLNAVKYCTHKLMGNTNIDAYTKTFPERYQKMINDGMAYKDINSRVSIYNRGEMVKLIMEQSIIPTHIINQDLYQDSINTLASLMRTAKSEKVRADSALGLAKLLTPPEETKIKLDVGVDTSTALADITAATMELAKQQRLAIESGSINAQQAAHDRLVTVYEHDAEEL